ncbi:MAG: hypothetical protein HPY66_1966 [Firmicutes bacterium]|nr:hypothetical protein [Bacillota bacterium]
MTNNSYTLDFENKICCVCGEKKGIRKLSLCNKAFKIFQKVL